MDMLLDFTVECTMFSFMDGFSGYNQIRLATYNIAFRTPIGHFYHTVLPFGLKNEGRTYQHTMTTIFRNMMHHELEYYVDDVVVTSKRQVNHMRMNPLNVCLVF